MFQNRRIHGVFRWIRRFCAWGFGHGGISLCVFGRTRDFLKTAVSGRRMVDSSIGAPGAKQGCPWRAPCRCIVACLQCNACNAVQCGLNGVREMVQRCNETRWSPKVFGNPLRFLAVTSYGIPTISRATDAHPRTVHSGKGKVRKCRFQGSAP